MSLFKPYKYKARPDLESNAPVKHGFFLFFELFFRKFWRFITLNIYYFLVTLPMLIMVYFTVNGYFADQLISESGEFMDMLPGIGIFASIVSYIPQFLHTPLLILSMILYGPATMGLTYIFRNFAREEHAWMSDFVSRGLSNFKQGLFFGILDIVVVWLLANGILGDFAFNVAAFGIVVKTLSVIALIVYLFMRHYFYTIAVTVNLSCFAILKNSWYFVVLGFWRNLWAGFVCLLALVVCFFTLPLVSLITLPLLFYSFSGFAVVFTCYPVVKKYIIVPALEQEAAAKGETVAIEAENEEIEAEETEEEN